MTSGRRVVKTSASIAAADGDTIVANAKNGSLTIVLPDAGNSSEVTVKKDDSTSNPVYIVPAGGEPLFPPDAGTFVTAQDTIRFVTDGPSWHATQRSITQQLAADAAVWAPLPTGTPANGNAVIVTQVSPLTLGFGATSGAPSGTAGGDLTGSYPNPNVAQLNGTALSSLGTGLLKNTTSTGVPSIATAADVPTVAAGGTGPLAANDATTTNSRAPSGSASGDLSASYPGPTVAKVQGVSITSGAATLLSQLNGAATRSATATIVAGEETVFTGSTASQTLTLPASPQGSTINTVANNSSVAVTIAAGAANTVNVGGVVGSITLSPGFSVQLVYISTVWYALDFGPTTRAYPLASDYGYAAMTVQPDILAVTSAAMSNAGTICGSVMLLDHVATITSLDFSVATGGSGLSASHCGVALFDSTKTLIGTAFTADGATDLATALTGTGKHTSTLSATGTGLTGLLPGKYYATMFQNGTTAAILRAPANTSAVNGNLSAANCKYFTADTGRSTTFPTTLGSFTAFSGANWFAIF